MKKVHVTVKTHMVILAEDDVDITEDVLCNMDYNFTSQTDGAKIDDTEIMEWEVTDTKQVE